jgi:hypothetical protein
MPLLDPDDVENSVVFDLKLCNVFNNSEVLKLVIHLTDNYVMNYAVFPLRSKAESSS